MTLPPMAGAASHHRDAEREEAGGGGLQRRAAEQRGRRQARLDDLRTAVALDVKVILIEVALYIPLVIPRTKYTG
jgi:hypothetical protein